MSNSYLSTFTASDGDNLALQDWPLEDGSILRGVIVLVHGLGEHAGRYDALARRLNDWGFAVRGYDQYGHGESGGVRGVLPSNGRLIDDLSDVVGSTRSRLSANTPLILLGHSMGGLIAAGLVALGVRPVQGLILSSPAFDAGMSTWQKLMLKVLPRYAPDFCVSNGLDPNYLSHDPDVVQAYRDDPLVHDRISGRLANAIATTGPALIAKAPGWKTPTLLLYGGTDKLVDPRGSRAFAAAVPKNVVTTFCFDDLFHEIFNELDSEPVFEVLKSWLDQRCPNPVNSQ